MLVILDNGHGGIINGVYQTAGKRSPKWSDGTQIFEGDINRKIVRLLSNYLNEANIENKILVPELEDISLKERVKRVNNIYKTRKDAILISVHLNAGGGTGAEFFTSKGETKSDKIAQSIIDGWRFVLPNQVIRTDKRDGDEDKEINFYILAKTYCPAVLVECAFMDKYKPDYLTIRDNYSIFAKALLNGIKNL